jgi:two-component system response regulator LytT
MNYQVAICDDEEFFRAQIRDFLGSNSQYVIKEYASGTKLCEDIAEGRQYDILFMDVDMPDMQGTDVVKRLREWKQDIAVCFVTSYEQYAYKAFQLEAVDYIVKPINEENLNRFLQKATEWIEFKKESKQAAKQFLSIRVNHRTVLVDVDDIVYIEKNVNACLIHTADQEIVCYDVLKNIYEQLDENAFLYIHQGYIINFRYLKEVKNNVAFMGNHIELPISRKYVKNVRQKLADKISMYRKKGNTIPYK